MENYIQKKARYLKALMLTMLVGFFAFNGYAQTITLDNAAANPTYYLNDDTDASVEYTTSAPATDFDGYQIYLHTGDAFSITQDEIITSGAAGTNVALTYLWGAGSPLINVSTQYNLTAAKGTTEQEVTNLQGLSTLVGGFYTGSQFFMNGVGLRRITTAPVDISGTDQTILNLFLNVGSVDDARPLVVQVSTNGTAWTNLTDTNGDSQWSTSTGAGNLTFILSNAQKTATTQFRVLQTNKSNYVAGEESWSLTLPGGGRSFDVTVGGLEVLLDGALAPVTTPLPNYTVTYPTTSGIVFNDDANTPVVRYYLGQEIEVEGIFTGGTNQVDDFDFSVVFENAGRRFLLENPSQGNTGNAISVTGTIPADVDEANWTVSIVAMSGSTPTLGVDKSLLGGLTRAGYNGDFDGDNDRFAISEALTIQSLTNGIISLGLTKTSNGLAASGTEIVLEFTTDGATFTPIGTAVSLNADLTDPIEFDISAVSGLISNSTQFRVRQLSNSGAELDTWDITSFNVYAGGTVLMDQNPIRYITNNIIINQPTISLEPVDVPAGLIYPGDEIDLTYNITNGAFPAGTELTAVFSSILHDYDYSVGTSTAITPGPTEDHTITISIPAVIGSPSNYSVQLISSTEAESNARTIPVFNTTINILEVASDNGVIDGTTDIIYPGDELTVTYTIDGSVGTGAELFLEVLDYGTLESDDSDDEWVVLSSITGAAIGDPIVGTLATDGNFDDNGNDHPTLRLRIGDGLLTTGSYVYARDLDDNNIFGKAFLDTIFDFDLTAGNDPNDNNNFIGTGTRSGTTFAYNMPYGAKVDFAFNEESYTGTPSTIQLQASNDGTNFVTIEEQEYEGFDFQFTDVFLPQTLWGESVSFRFIYNEDAALGEFDNEISFDYVTLEINNFTSANSDEFDFIGQFRKPTVSLEVLDNTNWTVGEAVEVEYTTEGPFPANTAFALVFTGNPDGENYGEVVATSTDLNTGTFTFNVPERAYAEDGTTQTGAFELFDDLEVVAYDASAGDFDLNEEIMVDMDDQFIVIGGNDENPGFGEYQYYFNKAGDRSLLTTDFDLSSADAVTLEFDFQTENGPMDNSLTIPQLQTSIDAGATFQSVVVGDMNMVGAGYLYMDGNTYSVSIDPAAITSATHFRWVQALNGGANEDEWGVENIKIILRTGNEITTYYVANNSPQGINVSHPSLGNYVLAQTDPNDAVFNGESVELSFESEYTSLVGYPAGVEYVFTLSGVTDPSTGEDVIIGTTTTPGTFTADIPFYAVNDVYDVDVTISKAIEGEDYFYESAEAVGSLEVFLRVAKLTYLGDPNATIYAGQDVTFAITVENDETNLAANADIFANIIFDDVLVAAQQGFGNITFALPTDAVGNLDFDLELSQGAPIGEVGEELMNSDYNDLEDDNQNFISDLPLLVEYSTSTFYESYMSYNTNAVLRFDLDFNRVASQNVILEYSINGGAYTTYTTFSGSVNNYGFYLPANMRDAAGNDRIRYRWRLQNNVADGSTFTVSDTQLYDASNGSNLWYTGSPGASVTFQAYEVRLPVNESGRRFITTRDFTADELADAEYLSFNVDFDQLPEDLTTNQYVNFEFSTDAGATYTELDSYPDMDADMILNGDMFNYTLTEAMKTEGVRFRWRQEEGKGDFEVYNIDINFGESIPFDYFNTDIDVVRQSLLLTSLSATEGCLDGDITLGYEIRGRFGADNVVMVNYKNQNTNAITIDGYEFNLVEGTGDVTFAMPSNVLNAGDDNEWFRFRLTAYDETTDNDFTVNGPYSEEAFELVAPVNVDAEFSFNTPLACESEEVVVELDDEQNYFMYEVINLADGTVLGSLTYDPETGDNEINIGVINTLTTLGLRITSMTESGTVCNTVTSSYSEDVEVQEMHMLYSNNGGANNYYRLATAGETVTVCNNNGANILSAQRLQADGSITTGGVDLVEWFRDNVNNPVETGSYLQDSDVTESGAYFARITTGSCVYTTESVQVNVVAVPNRPLITVTSGALVDCSSADPVVLTAPADFAYYLWSTGETTRNISVDDTRQVTLRVSDAPFGGGCGSSSSAPVQVDRYDLPDFAIRNNNTNEFIGANEEIDICEGFNVRFYDGNSPTNDGNITVVKDGADFATVESGNQFFYIEESGVYSFEWSFDNLNVDCTISSNEFTVNVVAQPTASPALTADGELTFCENEGLVTLTAPTGFEYYRWRKNNTIVTNPTQGLANANVLEVVNAGTYTVEVGNAAGCYSPESNAITVTSVSEPAYDSFYQLETGCGSAAIEFNVRNRTSVATVFQLINGETGQPSGNPITLSTINEVGTITSDVVEKDGTPFYLQLTYADGTGCVYSNADGYVTTNVRNIVLEVVGAQLVAIYETANVREVRWFRNGILLNNVGGSSITISDAAEYSIEVEYQNGCVISATSADLTRVLSAKSGASMDVNTYPNPSAGEMTVSIASEYMGLHKVVITTLTGQVMKSESFEKSGFESKHEISIAGLQAGMYNMQIQYDGLVKNVRIIKK